MHEHARSGVRTVHRESVAYALLAWRTAEETLRHPYLRDQRPAYERAVAAVLADLQDIRSVADLVGCYATDRLAVHAVVAAACAPSGDDPRLFPAVVEGTAFWRRLRGLVGGAVG